MKHILLVTALTVTLVAPARAQTVEDPREVEGRALFARGEYEKALELFSKLFAEKGDPVYLRNIGRSYQKLRKPARAIDAFQEYLRRGTGIAAEEKVEVEGFIREMEALKREEESRTTAAPTPATALVPPVVTPVPPAATAPHLMVTGQPETAEGDRKRDVPVTRRWWFWTAIGAAVVAGTVTVLVLATGKDTVTRPSCPRDQGFSCL